MGRVSSYTIGALTLVLSAGVHAAAQTPTAQPAKPAGQTQKPAAQTGKPTGTAGKTLNADETTRETNLIAYVELLRSDLRSQKVAIITEMMQFSEQEDAKFWPIYRQYETELAAINDDRMALIKDYADNYASLSDQKADSLATRALDLEARRSALKKTYYDKLKPAVGPKTAARFFQVENQILLLLDLQIASSLPLAK
jgi:hypothetical protein